MPFSARNQIRIAIVGTGRAGATCAYALLLRSLASGLVLINAHRERAEGEAMDLNHGAPFAHPVRIWAGDFADCAGADMVVLAAGVAQRPGETRLDLLRRNAEVFRALVPQVGRYAPGAILIVVTNPVDVLTYVTWQASGLPPSQVVGSGTILDTARFRYRLGQHFEVEPRNVHAFVIGEHGDSQVPVWSLATIAGMRLDDHGRLNERALDADSKADIAERTRGAAYENIQRKGATYYAIAVGLVRMIEAMLRDEITVLTVSSLVHGIHGLDQRCLSLPAVLNRQGVSRVLGLSLEAQEELALQRSARAIGESIAALDRANSDRAMPREPALAVRTADV